jgi:hypothetical protein
MTTRITKSMLLAGALLVATAGVARAGVGDVFEVKVPFSFTAGGQTFPAGRYVIERDDTASSVVMIRAARGTGNAAFMATIRADGPDPAGTAPALSFTRDADHYRLSTIWPSGEDGQHVVDR